MRVVLQRVIEAAVTLHEESEWREIARIGPGLVALLGVRNDDSAEDARYLADKIANLRIHEDEAGKLNRSLLETGGALLLVSNFTLYGDARKGRRPSFTEAASGADAETLYQAVAAQLRALGVPTQTGQFGGEMRVALVNDGPITLLLDSRKAF